MPSASDTVTTFLARWADPADLNQSFRDTFTPATVWENVGMATTTGADEAVALNESFTANLGMASIRVENIAVAETTTAEGVHKVLTERIDHLLDAEGRAIMSARCVGVFEVADGKITGWRDFFEPPAAAVAAAQA